MGRLVTRDRLVEIEDGSAQAGEGGELDGSVFGLGSVEADFKKSAALVFFGLEALSFAIEEGFEGFAFLSGGRSGEGPSEGFVDAGVVVLLFEEVFSQSFGGLDLGGVV